MNPVEYNPSHHADTVILLYFLVIGLRLLFNGSFPALWSSTKPDAASAAHAAAGDVQTAFKHLVILLLILAILAAMAETPAYPLAIGIEVVALVYILLNNGNNAAAKLNSVTAFLGSK